ncbi:MAG: precorrin-8X methylmutase [Acidimicrobiales bacterium]
MTVHPIEIESYRILDQRVDLSHLPPLVRAVVARIIHASADLDFAESVVADEDHLIAAVDALADGAPVVVDVEMVGAGITGTTTQCFLGDVGIDASPTRSAVAMHRAAQAHPRGAVFVIGCAPTALDAVIDLAARGALEPALVVGMPVGFVGAAQSKARLRSSGLPAVSNVGDKGGSAVAAAAVNALMRMAAAKRPDDG